MKWDIIPFNDWLRWWHLNSNDYYIMTWIYSLSWVNDEEGKQKLVSEQWFNQSLVDNILRKWSYLDYLHNSSDHLDYLVINEALEWIKESEKISKTSSIIYEDGVWSVISRFDYNNKYSDFYINCLWVVCISKIKKTWKNASFISHHETSNIWLHWKFLNDLELMLNFVKNTSYEWTIDIIILWWSDLCDFEEYVKWIEQLNSTVKWVMWFEASVVWWPSIEKREKLSEETIIADISKSIYVDTKERRVLFLKRHWNSIESNINFLAWDVYESVRNFV